MTVNSSFISKNEIAYWDVDLEKIDSSYFAHFYHSLSVQNKTRASLFSREKDRNLFVTAHYALDRILKEVFDVSPNILIDKYGKPYIEDLPIQFNISHTEDRVLLGFSHQAIGIDIEKMIELPDLDLLIEHSMHPDEILIINACNPSKKLQLFYSLWTKKEAIVKAMGTGLSTELNSFSLNSINENGSWNTYELAIDSRYSSAIAVQDTCCSIIGYQLVLTASEIDESLSRLIR
jgi:4'-phosphopantetheinyl transferase